MDLENQAQPNDGMENYDSPNSPLENEHKPTETPSSGGDNTQDVNNEWDPNSGFHTHPAWQKREDYWKSSFNQQEERHQEEIKQLQESIVKIQGQMNQAPSDKPVELPDWWRGEDTEFQKYQNWFNDQIKSVREQTIKEIEEKKANEERRVQESIAYFNQELLAIESNPELNPEGKKIDRNKLMKIAEEYNIHDEQGRWNWKKAYQLMKALEGPKQDNVEDKKRIAGLTGSDKGAEARNAEFKTPEDFKRTRPW